MRSRLSLVIAFALLIACSTTPIPESTRYTLPEDLTPAGTQLILLAAISNQPMPNVDNETPAVSAKRLQAYQQVPPAYGVIEEAVWIIEDVQPGVIRAGNRVRSHYLVVDVHYDGGSYWVKIVDGEDLRYDGTKIHPNALDWVKMLESRITQYFGYYRAVEQTRTPPPG